MLEIGFHSIFGIPLLIFFKLCIRVDIGNECLGMADANILSNNYRVMALDIQYFNKWTDFDILFCYKISGDGVCCMPAALFVFYFKMNAENQHSRGRLT